LWLNSRMKAISFFKKIDATDIAQVLGISLVGYGLFLVFGLGWALIGVGIILLLIGFFGN